MTESGGDQEMDGPKISCVREAFAGKMAAGEQITYGDVCIVRSEFDDKIFDIYATTDGEKQYIDSLRVTNFASVSQFEGWILQYSQSDSQEPETLGRRSEVGIQ